MPSKDKLTGIIAAKFVFSQMLAKHPVSDESELYKIKEALI